MWELHCAVQQHYMRLVRHMNIAYLICHCLFTKHLYIFNRWLFSSLSLWFQTTPFSFLPITSDSTKMCIRPKYWNFNALPVLISERSSFFKGSMKISWFSLPDLCPRKPGTTSRWKTKASVESGHFSSFRPFILKRFFTMVLSPDYDRTPCR